MLASIIGSFFDISERISFSSLEIFNEMVLSCDASLGNNLPHKLFMGTAISQKAIARLTSISSLTFIHSL